MKNHSNWLGFNVKILKEGFKKGRERFKTGFPWKGSLKTWVVSEWVVENFDTCFSTQNMFKQWKTKKTLNMNIKSDKNHFQKHIK